MYSRLNKDAPPQEKNLIVRKIVQDYALENPFTPVSYSGDWTAYSADISYNNSGENFRSTTGRKR
jgi:hypothetical protein